MKPMVFSRWLICGLGLLFLGGCVTTQPHQTFTRHTFSPAGEKVLLFVGQEREDIDTYLREVGPLPAGFMAYTSIQHLEGLFEPSTDRGAGVQDASAILHKYPDTAFQIGLYMVDALDGVLNGTYDGNIEKLAQWLKQVHRPVYLRIGYEFDFPDNHYDPEKYTKAFRYIVDHLRNLGVDNVAFVWHSYGYINPGRPMLNWYPGDDYVDWFGVSFFDCYNKNNYQRFAALAREHHKPLMLAEATPAKMSVINGQTTWDRWFRRMFEYVQAENVKAICYISGDWDSYPQFSALKWGDARLEVNSFIKDQWRRETSKNKYLKSSMDLFSEISFSSTSP